MEKKPLLLDFQPTVPHRKCIIPTSSLRMPKHLKINNFVKYFIINLIYVKIVEIAMIREDTMKKAPSLALALYTIVHFR